MNRPVRRYRNVMDMSRRERFAFKTRRTLSSWLELVKLSGELVVRLALLVLFAGLIQVGLVTLCWNALVPVTGLPSIDLWQAAAIVILFNLATGQLKFTLTRGAQ